jgi:predicted acylesterase/phospholipase RssA
MRNPSLLIMSFIHLGVAKMLFTAGVTGTAPGALIAAIFLAGGLTLGLAFFGDAEWQAKFPIKAALTGACLAAQIPWVALSLHGNLGNGAGAVELIIGLFFAALTLASWPKPKRDSETNLATSSR